MLQYIKGTLVDMEENSVIIDNHGIGFEIFISGQTMEYLPDIGAEMKMYVYFQVKEDGYALYGFLTKDDLRVFKLLISVNGVGPKGALGILSVLTPDDLRFAVIADDAKAIAKAPGIGPKTAQRVVLELKDKLKLEDAFETHEQLTKNPALQMEKGVRSDAVLALTALGYSASEATQVLADIPITPESEVEDILKLALKNLSRL
jgi:Holliday junction DNA helicase RuvA